MNQSVSDTYVHECGGGTICPRVIVISGIGQECQFWKHELEFASPRNKLRV